MAMKYSHMFFLGLLLVSGCSEDSEFSAAESDEKASIPELVYPEVIDPDDTRIPETSLVSFSSPWIANSGQTYLSENTITYSPTESVVQIDVNVVYTESFERRNAQGEKTYGFDDITFERLGLNEYFIVNNTPDKITTLLVRVSGSHDPTAFVMDTELSPFSRSKVVFQQNIDEIRLINTNGMYLPQITMTGSLSAQEGLQCTSVCYSSPDAQQAGVYEILSSNVHKTMNNKYFLPEMYQYYRDVWCASSNRNCNPLVANFNYMRLGVKGHNLDLKVLSGPYSNEGVGGGSGPALTEMRTNSGGWLSIWSPYITEGNSEARPYDGRTQKTFFHEGAHGYGFNHDSGMTYGIANFYGLQFLDKYFSSEDIEGVSELKPSSIVPVLIESNNKYLKYKLLKLEDGDDIQTVFSRVLSPQRIARRDRFVVENGTLFYELEFEQYPTQAVVIQFYDDVTSRVSTTREIANFYQPDEITVSGSSLKFFELPPIALQGRIYSDVNRVCRKFLPGTVGATEGQYRGLWSSNDFDSSRLVGHFFISSNMSQTDRRWKINMKDTASYSRSSLSRYANFGDQDSVLCVK